MGWRSQRQKSLGTRLREPYLPPVLHSLGLVLGIFTPRGSFSTHGPVLHSDHYQASWAAGHQELEPSVPGA